MVRTGLFRIPTIVLTFPDEKVHLESIYQTQYWHHDKWVGNITSWDQAADTDGSRIARGKQHLVVHDCDKSPIYFITVSQPCLDTSSPCPAWHLQLWQCWIPEIRQRLARYCAHQIPPTNYQIQESMASIWHKAKELYPPTARNRSQWQTLSLRHDLLCRE